MNLFWDKGYNSLSFNEISHETGLTRASLYNAFETKEALFLEALQRYFENAPDQSLRDVKPGQPVGPAFHKVLKRAAQVYTADKKKRGCMAVNCLNELMGSREELNTQMTNIYENYKRLIKSLIEQAIDQRELPKNTDPEMTANMIFTFMNGFSVFAKSKTSKVKMEKMALDFLRGVGFSL